MCAPNGLSTSFYATRIKKEKWLGNELERKILKVVGGCFAEYSHATRQILASRRQTVHGSELGTYIHHQLHHRRQRGYWGQTLNVRLTDWLWKMKTRKANIILSSARKRRRWIFELGDSHSMWKEISPVAPLSSPNNSDFWDYRGSREFCLRRRRRNRTWQL